MKRLLGVVLVLFMACVPMNIHAKEVDLSFEYSAQKVKIENAIKYYTIEGELLDEAPIDCGTYIAWTSDEEAILFEINPKKVPVKVTYKKDWRESDPEEEKYTIVGSFKTDPVNGKISNESPLAKALIGHGVNEIVTVGVAEAYDVKIVDIEFTV